MRRIDKGKIFSSEYKKWVDRLERDNQEHPENSKYRPDVVINLFYCQDGLCAYTEMRLCSPDQYDESHWKKGRYKGGKIEKFGNLEHFDPRLKKKKFWKWENLFMVHSDINNLKRDREVDNILKPDLPGYDPFKLLGYSMKTHYFFPHLERDKAERKRINQMIDVLQLNHGTVSYERESFLNEAARHHELDLDFEPRCFFTAYEMAKKQNFFYR